MLNQVGGSKADTIVKLVLIFFISLLSFSVGTFVGKQVSDSDYKRAALEEDYKSFRQAGHGEDQKVDHEEKVTDEELTSLTEEFVKKEKAAIAEKKPRDVASTKDDHPEAKVESQPSKEHAGYKKYSKGKPSEEFVAHDKAKKDEVAAYKEKLKAAEHEKESPHQVDTKGGSHEAASHEAKSHETTAAHSPSPVTKEAQRVADGKAPVADPAKVRTPTSVLPSVATSSVGKYTVQVASYATEEEAKAHASELKQKGWNAFYVPADVKGRTWFRVSIGLFTNQKSAMSFREELMKQSAISSAIIQRIVQ
ncbi:MAG: SPOR domain-containing protein [Bdellovibrionaceae bacterium]|nr:SPOR domain-containing protein [Bdellovibrionales bacterium]MCB9086514.1 SPOR domain-containing protein [Pseudobdellovibrionaceae bacterium]